MEQTITYNDIDPLLHLIVNKPVEVMCDPYIATYIAKLITVDGKHLGRYKIDTVGTLGYI